MTCSRESAKRFGADRVGSRFVSMRDAVVRNRALDFAAGLVRTDGSRNCVGSVQPVEAHAGHGGIVGIPIAAGWRRKLGRRRNPGRPLEDVLQRTPLLDVDREVCSRQIQQEARWLQEPLANAVQRGRVGKRLSTRQSRGDGDHADQPERNRAHLILTIPPGIWPVEERR
jgi:hypothetical protein